MRSEIVSIRLSQVEKKRLKKAAKKNGIPISDLIRRLLWKQLAGLKSPGPIKEMGEWLAPAGGDVDHSQVS